MYQSTLLTGRTMLRWSTSGLSLRPTLFLHLAAVAQSHGVQQQQYADDTQLYIALTSSDPSSELAALQSCLTSLQVWFYTNGMA